MAFAPGVRLGPYEIVALVGAGAMGEVYRARDTRLARDVAIKVLPAAFATDPDRLRRFEQEARTAGSLHHPNVLAIYDIGFEQARPFIVSELLEGETAEARLRGGPLPVRKAIEYGVNIARGLAAAHNRGVVHRDLKPANLFITTSGHVKILDFGVAKLTPAAQAGAEMATHALPLQTDPGTVLGTVSYMSPEQVRGSTCDHRSDIFALGTVLFEMIAGRRPFDRPSPVETMNAILHDDVPEISRPGADVSPTLDRVIQHCLEKDPADRFQSADDLAFNLATAETSSGMRPAVPMRKRRRWLPAAVLVLGLLLAAGMLAPRLLRSAPPRASFQRVTFREGRIENARFAPDGHSIVYSAAWGEEPIQVYSVRPESTESTALGYNGASVLAVAPSGELALSLDYQYEGGFIFTGTLARAPLGGGAPREVLQNVEFADWAPDGSNLAIVREMAGSTRIEYPPGRVIYRTGGWVSEIRFSPRGDRVAFVDHPLRGDSAGTVMVVDLQGNRTTLTGEFASLRGLAWWPSGSEVWFTGAATGAGGALYAVDLNKHQRLVADAPGGLTVVDISAAGRVLLARASLRLGITAKAKDQQREHDLSWLDWSLVRDMTPDGRKILFDETGDGGGSAGAVYVRALDGSPAVRLGDGIAMGLSPDGQWALTLQRSGRPEIILLPVGPGEPRRIAVDPRLSIFYARWMPDGRHALLNASERGHGARLYTVDLATPAGAPTPFTPEGAGRLGWNAVSPDGKVVAAVNSDNHVLYYPTDGSTPRPVAGAQPGELPVRWSDDGRYVWLLWRSGLPAKLIRIEAATGRREIWKELTPLDPTGVISVNSIALTGDGSSYAFSAAWQLSELYVADGLR